MPNLRAHSIIRPKISTMPRSKTEASEQLELYKKVTARQRIKRELQLVEQRTRDLQQKLTILDREIQQSEARIQTLRQSTPASRQSATPHSPEPVKHPQQSSPYQTFHLEY